MRPIRAATMHQAHDELASRLLYAGRDYYDQVTGMDGIMEHVYLQADSMVFDYDLKRVWVPPSRWTMMIRQYLDPEEVNRWLNQIDSRLVKGKKPGRPIFRMESYEEEPENDPVLRTQRVSSRKGGKSTVRNLGSCMLTLSISLSPRPTITLHSRACYVGYLSPLDMGVAYHLGRLAADVAGIPLESFRFVWFIETAQFHQFRTIAFALGDEEQRERFLSGKDTPDRVCWQRSLKHFNRWRQQDAEGVLYRDMQKFVSYQRLRKRYHSEVLGYDHAMEFATDDNKAFRPLPSTPISSLTFEKIGLE
ncbi:hypothetical protein SEA_MSCARN_53 [Gordonia phage MScarn]|uniref:Uncharacterized protein n=1 Tax=Gordonia phage MScarn TaxID=2836043 RepID=A0A8F3IQ74_9CAUD|nr:hypothetical protein SEA_MSCARN_53 [Gordonia phage MScarn]